MSGALDGTVILDLTRYLSGPYCTLMLAGMGAQVIKIDNPAGGDPTAAAPPLVGPQGVAVERVSAQDFGIAYLKRQRGKRSITINLKDPQGLELLKQLVVKADVLVENFRPGVAQRLGIDYEVLRAINPRLIYCAISGFGATGPDAGKKSYDMIAQAATGVMSLNGDPQGPPTKFATPMADTIAGVHGALAVVGALHERTRSGLGQAIDLSMVDCLFSMIMDEPLDYYAQLGLNPRQGNRTTRLSPFNAYQATDGWLVIGVTDAQDWENLLTAMGRAELVGHADYARVQWRITNNALVDDLVGQWTSKYTVSTCVQRLEALDVPCSPVRSPEEVFAWDHLLKRGMMRDLQQPDGTSTGVVAAEMPFKFSRSNVAHNAPAPLPGADTEQVLAQLLDLDGTALQALRERGVI